jgi:quinol monooxygenase YgiN
MKVFFRWLGCLSLLMAASVGRASDESYPPVPGNLFIHEKIADLKAFQKTFQDQRQNLKNEGFLAYSLHRDLQDPKSIILTLKCSDLEKAMAFIRSDEFRKPMEKAGVSDPIVWEGMDVMERKYEDRSPITGGSGVVIANNRVRSYSFWKKCWDAEGKHNHPGRGYKNSNYSIHKLGEKPATVIVAHEASDITKAPAFMNSPHMKGVMESIGVIDLKIWYGINLEEGVL